MSANTPVAVPANVTSSPATTPVNIPCPPTATFSVPSYSRDVATNPVTPNTRAVIDPPATVSDAGAR